MLKFVNYEKIITDLKLSVDESIEELNSLYSTFTSEMDGSIRSENALLREKLNSLENKKNKEFNFVKKFEEAMLYENNINLNDTLDFVIYFLYNLIQLGLQKENKLTSFRNLIKT